MKKYVIQQDGFVDWVDLEVVEFEVRAHLSQEEQEPDCYDWHSRLKFLKQLHPSSMFRCVVREETILYVFLTPNRRINHAYPVHAHHKTDRE